MKSVNENGEYALYDQGKIIGYKKVLTINGVKVIAEMMPVVTLMISDAAKDGVIMTLAAGLRTWDEQFALRVSHVIDKSKVKDTKYLETALSSAFNPVTAAPGFSNHQDGKAYDFNVTGFPKVYAWLVKNAIKYGFVRTVPSELWHWEYYPEVKDMFKFVPRTHPTWDKLV